MGIVVVVMTLFGRGIVLPNSFLLHLETVAVHVIGSSWVMSIDVREPNDFDEALTAVDREPSECYSCEV
jgi:hypothetical protein